ncbi:hypothetical protein FFF34_009630 [Inquilinus sp. KBS0705]|nr:hypothetical protein FFF34_009630 [Inquilinus sp. KBS0705]
MNLFYLNTLTPDGITHEVISSAFSATYSEYNTLKKKYPDDVDGIVTVTDAQQVMLSADNFSLAMCIGSLDRTMRSAAYSAFTKYPFNSHFIEANEEEMIMNDYTLLVGLNPKDAYYLKVVADNAGYAFSMGLNEELRVHPLSIPGSDGSITELNNLYGEPANTNEIEKIIVLARREKLGNFERLLDISGDNHFSPKFQNGFEKLDADTQMAVISRVEKAIKRDGTSKFFPDNDLIKDVTPDNEKEINVCELRIFNPAAYRLYFYETKTEVIFASIDKKPTKEGKTKEQDNQIKNAASTIKQTLILNGLI